MHSTQNKKRSGRFVNRKGAMTVFLMCVVIVLIVMAAFSIEIARMYLHRTELRIATDAAANAGTRKLGISQDQAAAIAKAKEFAELNKVAGKGLELDTADVVMGRSQLVNNKFEFTASTIAPNSVRVFGRRTAGSPSGPIPFLFGSSFGKTIFEPTHESTGTEVDREIVLVLDRSGSMGWNVNSSDPDEGTRWEALDAAVDELISNLNSTAQSERVSLVFFNSSASVHQSLTLNYSLIESAIDDVSPTGGTNIADGISVGGAELYNSSTRPYSEKTMIVLTDGVSTSGDPVYEAGEVRDNYGCRVHTVTFSDGADQTTMISVAEAGDGMHFHASTTAQLSTVFQTIALSTPSILTK